MSRSREVDRVETIGRRAEEQQIKVYSKSPQIKAHFTHYSRNLRGQFRQTLGLYKNDDWRVHYRIFLYGTGDDVHSGPDILTSAEVNAGNRFAIKISVKIHDRFEEQSYRLALIKMLLVEQMLEAWMENPNELTNLELKAPDWMIHGFDHNLRHKELGRPSYYYSGFLKSGKLMKVDEIMEPGKARGLNPLSLEVFRASSAVLVGALCDQKDGGESIRGMLQDIAVEPEYDPKSLIRKHFPGFRETGEGIDKWWSLQLATMAQQQSFEYFSPEHTEEMLVEALKVEFPAVEVPSARARKTNPSFMDRLKGKVSDSIAGKNESKPAFSGSISQYRQFLDRGDKANQMIRHRQASLKALNIKAFPLYRNVIGRYTNVCEKLLQRDFAGVDKELADLESLRKGIQSSLEKSRDYLNYYEATRSPKRSDAFDSYLKFKESIKNKPLPPRTDPIATFMDSVESQRTFAR